MKKDLSLILLALMPMITSVQIYAYDFQSGGIYYNIDGGNVIVTSGGTNYQGNIVIPSQVYYNGTTYSVAGIGDRAFENCTDLRSVSIPNSVKTIERRAFLYCSGLTSIMIPNSVTNIGYDAFAYCSGLSSIKVENGNSYYDSRNNCNAIIEKKHNLLVSGCKNTVIPNNVEIIGTRSFQGCSGLTSITIPNSVTSIQTDAFVNCSNLRLITIPNSVVGIGEAAFYGCKSLTSFTIPNTIKTVSSSLLGGCISLTSVTIPESVTYICEGAFQECMSLETITIPSNVVKIEAKAFYNCSSLTNVISKIKIPFGIFQNVFQGISPYAILTVPNGSKPYYEEYSGWTVNFSKIVSSSGEEESIVVTANSYSREYGDENPYFDYTTSGAYLNGTPTISCEATKSSPVGTYPIKIAKGSVTNGNVTYVNGTLTITKAPLTITAKSYSREEGQANPLLEVTYSGFKNNETEAVLTRKPTVSTTANSSSAPGTYDITVSGAEARNYSISYVKGTLTVTSSTAVTLTANSYEREYGEPNPSFGYTVSGAALNGKPTISCEATKSSPVGTYPIKITQGSVTNNNVTYVDGTLTVTKAPLTVTAKSCTREQGQENPTFEVTYDGFKNGENESVLTIKPTASTTATSDSAPGTYDITVSGGEAQNYSFIYKKGVLTVTEMESIAFEVSGISYIGMGSSLTAEVMSVNSDVKDVAIPASVTFNGKTYQVTSVHDNLFSGLDVNYISLPASVATVTDKTFSRCNMGALIWNAEAALPDNVFNDASMGTKANFLLYVNSASYAPAAVKNVVVNGVASSVLLSDEGGMFYCPEAFMAGNISYTHNYSMETGGNGMGWETIALPFNVQKITHSVYGQIVPFASYSSGSSQKPFWLCNFTGSGFRRTSTIQANEPYIIAMPNSKNYRNDYNLSGNVTFSAENVIVPKTPEFSGQFVPAYTIIRKSSSVLALNVNNRNVSYSGNYDAGSRFISNLRDVRPYEAYIYDNSTRGIFDINIEDGTTDVKDILIASASLDEVTIHTLGGLVVKHTSQRDFKDIWHDLPKGVYIVNGKKMIK